MLFRDNNRKEYGDVGDIELFCLIQGEVEEVFSKSQRNYSIT